MLRQGDTGDWVGTFEGHKGAVWGVALNADATLAASGAADFSARVWNAVSGEEKVSFQHKHIVKSVSFDGPCERLVTGSNEKLIRVFSLQQPTSDPDLFPGHGGSIKRAVFFRNDRCIVSCAEDKTMRVWDRSSGAEVQRIDFATTPNSLELSADQSMLTVAHGTSVSFFDADTLGWQKEVKVGTLVAAASLHPDKHMFVCGGEDFKMYKFDYANGNEIGRWSTHVICGCVRGCTNAFALPYHCRVVQGSLWARAHGRLQSGRRVVRQWVRGRHVTPVADDSGQDLRAVQVHGPNGGRRDQRHCLSSPARGAGLVIVTLPGRMKRSYIPPLSVFRLAVNRKSTTITLFDATIRSNLDYYFIY